jgi:hypothetical protein
VKILDERTRYSVHSISENQGTVTTIDQRIRYCGHSRPENQGTVGIPDQRIRVLLAFCMIERV